MAKACGELKGLSNWHSEKARAVFGEILIGNHSRPLIGMARKGLLGGFVWYAIFSPFMLAIPAASA